MQVGSPEAIGVLNLGAPDYGEPVELREGEVPVFWACGVTPQAALAAAKLPLAVTHAPGHMFVTDCEEAALAKWAVEGEWAKRPMLAGLGVDVLYTLDVGNGGTVSVAQVYPDRSNNMFLHPVKSNSKRWQYLVAMLSLNELHGGNCVVTNLLQMLLIV